MGVLSDKQRVEATLFDRSGQGSWRDSFVGHERRDAELHTFIEPYLEASEVSTGLARVTHWQDGGFAVFSSRSDSGHFVGFYYRGAFPLVMKAVALLRSS